MYEVGWIPRINQLNFKMYFRRCTYNICKDDRFEIDDGIVPLNRFRPKSLKKNKTFMNFIGKIKVKYLKIIHNDILYSWMYVQTFV